MVLRLSAEDPAHGVDCLKTDFGERIPVKDIAYFDGKDPLHMHNYYTFLYNKMVFDLLKEERGEGRGHPVCPQQRPPEASSSPSTGAATTAPAIFPWPRPCAPV